MNNSITVYVRGRQYIIPFEEIIYMEKDLRKIIMHTKKGDITFYGRYCDVMPLLDERFANCHRSFVLNMDEIRRLSENRIIMSNDDTIRFGIKCFNRLKRAYREYYKDEKTLAIKGFV